MPEFLFFPPFGDEIGQFESTRHFYGENTGAGSLVIDEDVVTIRSEAFGSRTFTDDELNLALGDARQYPTAQAIAEAAIRSASKKA